MYALIFIYTSIQYEPTINAHLYKYMHAYFQTRRPCHAVEQNKKGENQANTPRGDTLCLPSHPWFQAE